MEEVINYNAEHDVFWIPRTTEHYDRLFEAGWRELTPGVLSTSRLEAVEPFEPLFSEELRSLLGSNRRKLAEIDEKTWSRIIPKGETLHDHQKFTIRFAIGAGFGESTAVGDAPGAGKTATNIVLANYWEPTSWLIVCPSSMKYRWKQEIERWSTRHYELIEVCENATAHEHMERIKAVRATGLPYVMILNYDIMQTFVDVLKNGMAWDLVTYDEAHRFTGSESQRTLFALGPVAPRQSAPPGILARNRLFTTATSMNRPIHLWPLLRVCDPKGLGRDYWEYVQRYCYGGVNPKGHIIKTGAHNVEELGYLMGQSFYVRQDIDHLLPAFREETILLAPAQEVADAERELFAQLLTTLDDDDPNAAAAKAQFVETLERRAADRGLQFNVNDALDGSKETLHLFQDTFVEHAELLTGLPVLFEMITKMRLVTGAAKQRAIVEYVEKFVDQQPDEPIVVMLHHKALVSALYDRFGPRARKVVGGVTAKRRQKIVESFQAGEFPIFIGNIAAAGEGLTLTRACHLVFGEIDWNATSMWQALKRIHRLTQLRECVITFILLDESLDAKLTASYLEKRGSIAKFFDGAEIARAELADGEKA